MKWKTTFSYRQQDYRTWPSFLKKEIQKIKVNTNVDSQRLRVIFGNEFGVEPIVFEQVNLKVNEDQYVVTKNHEEKIVIYPGETFSSDILMVSLKATDEILLSSHLAANTIVTSGTVTYSRQVMSVENFQEGHLIKQSEQFRMVKENPRMCMVYGIIALEQLCTEQTKTIAVFGDSLTQQGFWIDGMKLRLRQEKKENIAILNIGIGGNRVLEETDHSEDGYYRHGYSGLSRFEDDVFGRDVPDFLVIQHGINDLVHQSMYPKTDFVKVPEIITGLEQYCKIAKEYGIVPIGVTISPLRKSIFFNEKFENARLQLNNWYRSSGKFSGIIDLDEYLKDPDDPSLLLAEADTGDGLHYSLAGGHLAASKMDLSIFNL
ncbi:SGNH/GDSL hydrolase family protein [Enterococcus timonensis]|uniref:SGNH/GDSL hydrolase family protein n=1 Tax=Enterococcus timonensis TaxID=1852364 RepID=UPI0008DB014A|nr:SGNH/GDSL hydrolase family protein [Enterococcus timonensis]